MLKIIRPMFSLYRILPFGLRVYAGRAVTVFRRFLPKVDAVGRGFSLCLDYEDNASFKYLADGADYERQIVDLFADYIETTPDCMVLDIGANYGFYALTAASLLKHRTEACVFAFEPDPKPYTCLLASVSKNGLDKIVKVEQAIVSDTLTEEAIYINSRSSADNRSHKILSAPIDVENEYKLSTVVIDKYIMSTDTMPDLKCDWVIKMDIQGNELRALYGMSRLLNEFATRVYLFIEYAPYLLRSAGFTHKQFIEYISQLSIVSAKKSFNHVLSDFESKEDFLNDLLDFENTAESKMQGAACDYILVISNKQ